MKPDVVRLSVYMKRSINDDLKALADQFGVNKNKIIVLSITTGLEALKMALNPDWRKYFEKIEEKYETGGGSGVEPHLNK